MMVDEAVAGLIIVVISARDYAKISPIQTIELVRCNKANVRASSSTSRERANYLNESTDKRYSV